MRNFPFLLLMLLLLAAAGLFAQEDTLRLTLAEAQLRAIERGPAYQISLLDRRLAEEELALARLRLYPQVDLALDARYYFERPPTLLPGEAVGRPGEVAVVQLGGNIGGAPVLDLRQVVFDPTLFSELKILREAGATAELQIEVEARNLKLQVAKSYVTLLAARERQAQLRQTARRLESTLEQVRAKVSAGLLPALEEERVLLTLEQNRAETSQAAEALEMSELLLKQLLGVPPDRPIALTQPFEPEEDPAGLPVSPADLSRLPEYRLGERQVRLIELESALQRRAVWPRVSLYSQLGVVALGKKVGNEGEDQLSWYFNSFVGLKAVWEINRLVSNGHRLDQLELERRQAEWRWTGQEDQLALAAARAGYQFRAALETLRLQRRRAAFAENELIYLQTRFQSDLAGVREVLEAEEALSAAQRAVQVAYYDCWAVKFDLLSLRDEL